MADYEVVLRGFSGEVLASITGYSRLEYARSELSVGALTLTVPVNKWDSAWLRRDLVIEVYRSLSGGQPQLEMETAWLIRGWQQTFGYSQMLEISAVDLNHLLTRRIVDYNIDDSYTLKLDYADDMMKEIVSENMGSGATDATRSIASYLSIAAEESRGPILRKAFARRNVLETLAEIAQSAEFYGTKTTYDIVAQNQTNPRFLFKTYVGQRGTDRSFPDGQYPLLIGPDYGNFTNATLTFSSHAEATRGIAGGATAAGVRAVARVDNDPAQAASPLNLCEFWIDASQDEDATGLTNEARAALIANRAQYTVQGNLASTLVYGKDYFFGDKITVQVNNQLYTRFIGKVHVTVDASGEQVATELTE